MKGVRALTTRSDVSPPGPTVVSSVVGLWYQAGLRRGTAISKLHAQRDNLRPMGANLTFSISRFRLPADRRTGTSGHRRLWDRGGRGRYRRVGRRGSCAYCEKAPKGTVVDGEEEGSGETDQGPESQHREDRLVAR